MNQKPQIKHFHLDFPGQAESAQFERFQKSVIMSGKRVGAALRSMVQKFNKFNPSKIKLMYEPAMLQYMKEKGVSRTRQSLKKLRDADKLVGPDGSRLWGTDGTTIVYNADGVIKFFKERNKAKSKRTALAKARRDAA